MPSAITITYHDWSSVAEHADAEIAERIRGAASVELLEAHWDVVLEKVPLGG